MNNVRIQPTHSRSKLVLIAGASGYVGGRLLGILESRGQRVRCLARRPEALRERVADATEVVPGDVLEPASLPAAMAGVHTAYYLVHAMASASSFESEDRTAAETFAAAARAAGVRRIIYLGGLGRGEQLSVHLRSRQEVGRILRHSGVPTIEFRTSIIVGSGSVSFEIVRALVEKLPVMTTPTWVRTRTQPIAIEDVVAYLIEALDAAVQCSKVFEIGGSDQVSYLDLMKEYARQRGLKRWMIPVPVLSPRLSSLWLGIVTPVYARVGRELVESLRNQTIVTDQSAAEVFSVRPLGFRAALKRALVNEDQEFARTRWSDAFSSARPSPQWGGNKFGRRIVDSRSIQVPFSPAAAFQPIERLGGATGWYYGNWLWRTRGVLDLLFRGAGMRRGRRSPTRLFAGDTVDFWRVEKIEPARLLRLAAEMRLPGRAWLQFEVEPAPCGSLVRQTAIFDPVGLMGQLYWYLLYPIHRFMFAGMLAGIVRAMQHPA
ncbi:MAG: SDR family oxidoreductase [Acidobacteriota bacterium]|nr:SDR family oxidoreductase [Acidobacteriota bacterium]